MNQVCSQCKIERNVATDHSFIPQQTTDEIKAFCSTFCLKNFWLDPANAAKIVLETDPDKIRLENATQARLKAIQKLGVDEKGWSKKINELLASKVPSELVYIQLRYEGARYRTREDRACGIPPRVCAICPPATDGNEYFNLASVGKVWVCSIEHMRQYLEHAQPFECKGYWQRPERLRCHQCGLLARHDDQSNIGYGPIVLEPDEETASQEKRLQFCSPGCCAAYLKTDKPAIPWRTVQNRELWENTCERQDCTVGKHKTNDCVFFISAPYGSILDSFMGTPCFCSIECAISVLEEDERQRLKAGFGPWFSDE
ncbi:MAG: hypothetical protein HY602_03455 [Parcubacteria group bacterium]|nr:hypothetical protein [Parcubacteria group bacterium]